MKTLLIGFYDYSYHVSACVFENGELTDLKLYDYEIYDAVNCVAHNYASKEERQIAEEFFSQYDKVILCEDGDFKVLK